MNDEEKISFSSLEEKCQYYIKEYETYKSKFISLNKEFENLLQNIKIYFSFFFKIFEFKPFLNK